MLYGFINDLAIKHNKLTMSVAALPGDVYQSVKVQGSLVWENGGSR